MNRIGMGVEDLTWDSLPNNEYRYTRNPERVPLGGVIITESGILSNEFCFKFYNDMFVDERYEALLTGKEALEMREHYIRGLQQQTGSGFRFVHPAFEYPFSGASILFYNPPWSPSFNYDRAKFDMMNFKMELHEIQITNREQVYWFIDLMKRVFLYLDAEHCWGDHFDYLYKRRKDDARNYIFGLNFFGKKMVEKIGREKLMTAPVFMVEEFDNGSIMLQVHEHPFCKIPEKIRRQVGKHLGIAPPKKVKPPTWITKHPPKGITLEMEWAMALVAGVDASEVKIPGLPHGNLFEYYCEEVHSKIEDGEGIPRAIGFKEWFNGLNTGLEAFVAGSDETGEDEFSAFIGRAVGEYKHLETRGEMAILPVADSSPERIGKLVGEVKKDLKKLKIGKEPGLHTLLYLCQGEEL